MNAIRQTKNRKHVTALLGLSGLLIFAFLAAGLGQDAALAAQGAAPNLSGIYARGLYVKPPPGIDEEVILPVNGVIPGMFGPGPIRHQSGSDPAKFYSLGDERAPILKSRAAAAVREHNEAVESGRLSPPSPQPCAPSGLFMQLTNPGAVRISQTPEQITLEFQSDGDRRIIHMHAEHPAGLTPSKNGHSIGHWEGETLVVDTIGIDETSALDRYGTPHTADLHVVERIRLIHNGQALENHVFAEDSATFFAPWWGVVTYRLSAEPWQQSCGG
jgi:hypothetical protein